jgi:glutathione synthase/RimK-type ligase-like ATP-grasp enzyme
VYVLPFDPPKDHEGIRVEDIVAELFPNAVPVVAFAAHELSWNKMATQERLVQRGVPVPDTLISDSPADVIEFVRTHELAILKQAHSCGGQGHLVVWLEDDALVGDCGSHRYALDLVSGGRRRLRNDRLSYPSPFYLQRLVSDVTPRGVVPGQILRAYVVNREIVAWTERFRDRYTRPSDWIISHAAGAKYRFIHTVSDEAKKAALRAAEAVGARICAVDMIRTVRGGIYVLEVDCDGVHMFIDRSFKEAPEYREFFNLDRYIAQALVHDQPPPAHG